MRPILVILSATALVVSSTPGSPLTASLSCTERCQASGHYCEGHISANHRPSCAMGCAFGKQADDLDRCLDYCCEADAAGCIYKFQGVKMLMCADCPDKKNAVDHRECFAGCHHVFETGNSTSDLVDGSTTVCLNAQERRCVEKCKAAGHCCHGLVSSRNHASCAMGCAFGHKTRRLERCERVCDDANAAHCNIKLSELGLGSHHLYESNRITKCGKCPTGCESTALECKEGCKYAHDPDSATSAEKTFVSVPQKSGAKQSFPLSSAAGDENSIKQETGANLNTSLFPIPPSALIVLTFATVGVGIYGYIHKTRKSIPRPYLDTSASPAVVVGSSSSAYSYKEFDDNCGETQPCLFDGMQLTESVKT